MKSGFLTWIVWYGCFLMMSPSEPTCHLRTTVQNFVTYKPGYLELQLEYFSLAMAWKDTLIASFQIKRGWVESVYYGINNARPIIIGRKSTLKQHSQLWCLSGLYWTRDHSKTWKIYSEIYRCLEDVSGNPYISYKFSSSRILFNIGPINTKLQIFHILNVLFLTMWVLCCLYHNKLTHTQPFSTWN